jgi:hypothetical protein
MLKRLFISVFSLLSLVSPVYSWGPIGHIAVATIAQNNLNNETLSTIEEYVCDLPSIANWADEIKKESEWHWTAPLHYIDIDDWKCDYQPKRDCYNSQGEYGYCVDGAIKNNTMNLITQFKENTISSDDIKFLVHF